MPIRPATSRDIPAIAALCAASFDDDELYNELMHPKRAQYPSDYVYFFIRRTRESWLDWTHKWWVATARDEASNTERVVGLAQWEYKGSLSVKYGLWKWDPRRLLKPILRIFHTLTTLIYPNRAANPNPTLHRPHPLAYPFFSHHWSGQRSNSLYLSFLAVHPDYRGQGIAKELAQWGLDKAREEGVCASVISSRNGYGFYRRMGFGKLVGRCTEGVGNPMEVMESGGKGETGWILFAEGWLDGEGGS